MLHTIPRSILALVAIASLLAAPSCTLPEQGCQSDAQCTSPRVCQFGTCVDPTPIKTCGDTVVACNCQTTTLMPGQVTRNTTCESGQGQATPCSGSCIGGGVPWKIICYCAGGNIDGGPRIDGGTAQECPTFQAGIAPMRPPRYHCGPPGPIVISEMEYINRFWNSRAVACVYGADQPWAQNNAISYGGPGYLYYDPQFLARLDSSGMSFAPSGMVLAHEFGHEIQGWSSTLGQLSISRELGADCYAGYFLGWLGCQMKLSMNDYIAAFSSACSLGTSDPWWSPQSHGTCQQRIAAVQQGIRAYSARVPPLGACTF